MHQWSTWIPIIAQPLIPCSRCNRRRAPLQDRRLWIGGHRQDPSQDLGHPRQPSSLEVLNTRKRMRERSHTEQRVNRRTCPMPDGDSQKKPGPKAPTRRQAATTTMTTSGDGFASAKESHRSQIQRWFNLNGHRSERGGDLQQPPEPCRHTLFGPVEAGSGFICLSFSRFTNMSSQAFLSVDHF